MKGEDGGAVRIFGVGVGEGEHGWEEHYSLKSIFKTVTAIFNIDQVSSNIVGPIHT